MGAEEIRKKLLGKFREVTADRLERISSGLLELEKVDSARAQEEVLRELHTLKGEARMMGFSGIAQIAHAAEDLLAAALAPGARATGAAEENRWQRLLEATDAVSSLLDADPEGGEGAGEVVKRLRAAIGGVAPVAPSASPEQRAEEVEKGHASTSIRVDVDALDEIAALAGDLLVDGARAQGRSRDLAALLARWARLGDRVASHSPAPVTRRAPARPRAGEVGRSEEQLEGDLHLLRSDTFRFLRGHADAVSAQSAQFQVLAERVADARLIPLSSVFGGLPRAARDLAREQGKEVECTVTGAEMGVDKAILKALSDPLVHLLRNAIDHGIESPAERLAAKKPRAGQVAFTVRGDGDMLTVTLEDDGRGVDVERVRAAAVERGVLTGAQAAAPSQRAALELVFTRGFSTRAAASEVSGRGIGLDVVRRMVEQLGGSVTLASRSGAGSTFTLRLPQSLALMKVLLVRVDDDVFGLPAGDVAGVGRIGPDEVAEVAGIRTVRRDGRVLPVVALGPLLSLNGGPRAQKPHVCYLTHAQEGVALVVDGFHGEREVAVKTPGTFLKGMRFVAGAAQLEDGRVALLLSTADVIASARRLSQQPQGRGRARRRLKILLVDDSAIAREAEAALLRALGHEVDEAADGEEAWVKLQGGGYHLLLTDVQMPVLDGIELSRRVKASSSLGRLPIVILSSLAAPEERRRGVDAGADAYLVKGELDADALAATLERLTGVSA
jgi:two-component system chemotaxis sensor kinase CheA/two-component system sensor histidine kinase and response regulator WspE